jgi:hypothetical protein
MPSPPPEAVTPSSASFVRGYARRGTDQPPFASLLGGLTDHASVRDKPAAPRTPPAGPDPSRRFEAAPVHAPAQRDSAGTAELRPANESSAGSHVGSNQSDAASHAIASGQSAERSAKDTPAHEGNQESSTPDTVSPTTAVAAPPTQTPTTAAPVDTTGVQAAAALISLSGGGDTAAGAAGAASTDKGDDLAISGAKAPSSPSDVAPRPTTAAGAAAAAGPAGPTATAGAADQDADPSGDTPARGGALPRASTAVPGQLAETPATDTDSADASAKSGSGRLAPDGSDTFADRPQAAATTANATANPARCGDAPR